MLQLPIHHYDGTMSSASMYQTISIGTCVLNTYCIVANWYISACHWDAHVMHACIVELSLILNIMVFLIFIILSLICAQTKEIM